MMKNKKQEEIEDSLKQIEVIDQKLKADPESKELKNEKAILVSKIDFLKNKK